MEPDNEPWRAYFDEFSRRVERVPAEAFDRKALLYEVAHDTYEKSTNHLTAAGADAERALMLGRLFTAVVKDWINRGDGDLSSLERGLRSRFEEWH